MNDLYQAPVPKWLWWEFHPAPWTEQEREVSPLTRWRGIAVPKILREKVADLGRVSLNWSRRASIDIDPETRAALRALRDAGSLPAPAGISCPESLTLEEMLRALLNLGRKRVRVEVCADSRRKPPHRRTSRRRAAEDDDE